MTFNQELCEVGARIIEQREKLGMTATELAIQANISAKTLSQIETGQNEAKIGTLVAIATALEISLDYIQPKKLDQYSVMPKGMPTLIKKINEKLLESQKKILQLLESAIEII